MIRRVSSDPSGAPPPSGPPLQAGGGWALVLLFAVGAVMGAVAGDQPGLTLFCAVVAAIALAAQLGRFRGQAMPSLQAFMRLLNPRRWSLGGRV
jgi:hypothetical protein